MDIKLIIWDLDDTLWQGLLAEGEEVRLNPYRAAAVGELNKRGIISSICSKNDAEVAQKKLTEFGLWDEFVFPRMAFIPKSTMLRQMIDDMQLRPANVLFIDDDDHNLGEAQSLMPELNVVHAGLPDCDALLHALLRDKQDVQKNRIAEYKMLEARVQDRKREHKSNEDFLRTCDIHVTLVMHQDNFFFQDRIINLVNRSNQLNFTKSRIDPDNFSSILNDRRYHSSCSVFVRDKYGHHGLVGFILAETPHEFRNSASEWHHKFIHFAFSCRIMHMGIENWVLRRLQHEWGLPANETAGVPLKEVDWITEDSFQDSNIRDEIMNSNAERKSLGAVVIRVMADCQSAAIAHFTGMGSMIEFDNAPRLFELWMVMTGEHLKQNWPPLLVYGAFVDYTNARWKSHAEQLDSHGYQNAVEIFCAFLRERGKRILVVLAPENASEEKYTGKFGVARQRVLRFNAIWRQQHKIYPEVSLLELSSITADDDMDDVRHYKTSALKKIAEKICLWVSGIDIKNGLGK